MCCEAASGAAMVNGVRVVQNTRIGRLAVLGLLSLGITVGYAAAEYVKYNNGAEFSGTFESTLPGAWLGALPCFFLAIVLFAASCQRTVSHSQAKSYVLNILAFLAICLADLGVFTWIFVSSPFYMSSVSFFLIFINNNKLCNLKN